MQSRHPSTLRSATSMRPLAPRGLTLVAATIAAVAAGAPAAPATPEQLAPLAPMLEEASRLATLESLRQPPKPPVVFPTRGLTDFGEQDARFGAWRGGHVHEGQDVFAPAGTPLVAMRDGRVVETGDDGGRGNYVAIWNREADSTFVYLHMVRPPASTAGTTSGPGNAWAPWAAPARAGATISTSSCAAAAAPPAGRVIGCRS